ncbi:MAG: hypothetical protein NTZ28_02715 [Nitrospirae bacterium]|nr:hypothetical protein [Nitrospirota bacterium]
MVRAFWNEVGTTMIAEADNTRVVDLCCGMGGLSVAARQMGMRQNH